MRNYWLRIVFGAIAIFAVGMVGVTLARQGIGRVHGIVHGSGPITLPVAFVPFQLDGQKIGTIQRIRINRLAPNQVSSVNITVRLADSVQSSRLAPCILVAKGFEQINSETTFRCSTPDDTTGEDLANVGQITVAKEGRSFKLLMPRDAIRELTDSDVVFVGEDSMHAAMEQEDSIAEAAQRTADSILETKRPKLESLGVGVPRRASGAHNSRRAADSARSR